MDMTRVLLVAAAVLLAPTISSAQPAQAQLLKPQAIKQLPGNQLLRIDTPFHARIRNTGMSAEVRSGDATWNCTKGLCSTRAAWAAPTVANCAALAAQAGTVSSFGNASQTLGAEDLAACNAGVGGAMPALSPRALSQAGAATAVPLPALSIEKTQSFDALVRQREQAEQVARSRERAEQLSAEARAFEQERLRRGLTEIYNQGDDCDDTRADVHRLAAEVCDNRDNNCDGHVDEGQQLTFFLDADGDGHGDPARRIDACPADQSRAAADGRWLVPVGNDCNDTDPSLWRDCP